MLDNIRPEWLPIYQSAISVITEAMEAGELQRLQEQRPTDGWLTTSPADRLHHAFVHLAACKTHEGKYGHPWVLAENTQLEQYKHALCGLAIVAAHECGFLESVTVDTTEDERKGE